MDDLGTSARRLALVHRFGPVALLACGLSSAVVAASLPDTGQITCYDGSQPVACSVANTPRQDGALGADAVGGSKIGGGVAGFDYSKLDAAGNTLAESASDWACARDNLTGLVWEVKTDAGLRGAAHRYAWANSNPTENGGDAGGTTDTAICGDSLSGRTCTTENYQSVINTLGLCGASDWRLPTQRELLTLIHAGAVNPAIDQGYFPNTASEVFWAANSYPLIPAFAWGVHFGYGAASADYKSRPYRVRLVRGGVF